MVKIGNHAKQRASERLDVSTKNERVKLFKIAMHSGIPTHDFKDELFDYLIKKHNKPGVGIKVYQDNIYVYKNKFVITVFPIPDRFKPVEQYYKNERNINPIILSFKKLTKDYKVELTVAIKKKDDVTVCLHVNDEFECFGQGTDVTKAKINAMENYLKKHKEK